MCFKLPKNIRFYSGFSLLGLLFSLNACKDIKNAVIHNYPKEKAFIYKNKVIVEDAINKAEAKSIANILNNYWDDSLKVKRIRQFGVFNTIVQPQLYNPERIPRTIQYMTSYLSSQGYNQVKFNPIVKIDTIKKEWRTNLTMLVQLNKKTIFDSITYKLSDPLLQNLVKNNIDNSFIKLGMAFSDELINSELDRLVALFRSNGFYNFTKEKIFAEVDTLNQALVILNLDPIDQMNQIKSATEKAKESPKWKISFQLRNLDPTTTKQYLFGDQYFFSDVLITENPDTLFPKSSIYKDSLTDIVHVYNSPKFKSSLFQEQSIIKKGSLYNEAQFYQTLNKFSSLGPWQQIDTRSTIEDERIHTAYFLVPSLRRSVSFDIEGSRNTAQLGSGNLLGLSTSLTYRDKNVQKKAIPSITSIRTGVELNLNSNNNLAQTLLWNVGHTYNFPSFLFPWIHKESFIAKNAKTNFSLNNAYMDRLDFYRLRTFTTNWGYEWKKTKKGKEKGITYRPLNIELYKITKFSKLDSLLILNPFLRSSFNEGNVISQTINYTSTGPSRKNANKQQYFRIGIEEAGGILGLSTLFKTRLYRYLKLETEIRETTRFGATEFAWRAMAGWGNNYNGNAQLDGQLPFFKQFTAGGPYSMRAWGLRQLGLGSSRFYDTSAKSQNFDRFGDLQLEANLEYRFPLFQVGSYKMSTALFTDIGNIWNTRNIGDDPRAGFKLDRLAEDLAVAVGTGLRMDFNYFIVRIDYALKMKDPTRLSNNGWLDMGKIKWSEIKPNGLKVNNYAWQFGIGLPF